MFIHCLFNYADLYILSHIDHVFQFIVSINAYNYFTQKRYVILQVMDLQFIGSRCSINELH